jgi:hypothetical protein
MMNQATQAVQGSAPPLAFCGRGGISDFSVNVRFIFPGRLELNFHTVFEAIFMVLFLLLTEK